MSLLGLYDVIKEQQSEIRSLTCINKIFHEMVQGNTKTVCLLKNEKELKLHHREDYRVTKNGDSYLIDWSKESKGTKKDDVGKTCPI